MVAITAPTPLPSRPRLRLVVHRPAPRYGLRRLAVLVVLVLALALGAFLADSALGALSGRPTGTATPAGAARSGTAAVVVVQPGDTLWSIAAEIDPDRDPRAAVDRLAELNGGADLEAGQVLELP